MSRTNLWLLLGGVLVGALVAWLLVPADRATGPAAAADASTSGPVTAAGQTAADPGNSGTTEEVAALPDEAMCTPAPAPDCPPCRAEPARCPACPRCAPCAACPPSNVVCKPDREAVQDLAARLEKAETELARLKEGGPRGRYDAPTAHERRALAAREDHLLLEFPAWGEELRLPDDRAAKFALDPDERQRLEELYREFRLGAFSELQQLYGDLVGDPQAGTDSTINALIHNIMSLSPQEACRERTLAVVAALAANQPLPAPSPGAPPCEQAILILFSMVDRLEQEVNGSLGENAFDALWSGTSSFTYSTSASPVPD